MVLATIILAAQSTYFKLKQSTSKDSGIFIDYETFETISPFVYNDEENRDAIKLIVHKDDCIRALGNIMCSLPLFTSKSGVPREVNNPVSIYDELNSAIIEFFGDSETRTIESLYFSELQNRKYLWGTEGRRADFELRKFFVANHTELSFVSEDSDELHVRFQTHLVDENKKLFEPKNIPDYKIEGIQNEPLQQIFFGAPGTGKSFKINEMCAEYENYRTTFHPDTDYASFVGSYKPITKRVPQYDIYHNVIIDKENNKLVMEDRIVYRYVFQSFLKAYIAAWREQQNEQPKPVFLVVEEINRGNCAQIFGDIFQLLDRNEAGYSDYPIVADDDLAQELKREFTDLNVANADGINALYKGGKDVVGSVKNGARLLLPNNLYIWATMNTSDQSLFPIDSAFKRRWDWKYIKIKDNAKDYIIVFTNGNKYDWWQFVTAINERIEGGEIQQEDKKLGYFFAKSKNGIITAERFLSKVIFFLYNDVFKDFGFDEDYFKGTDGQPMTFVSYFDESGEANEDQIEHFLNNLGMKPIITTGNYDEDGIDGDSDLGHEGLLQNSDGDWVQPTFTVNGETQSYMIDTVLAALRIYFDKNPDISTEAAISEWNSFGLPKHALETEETFNARTDISKSRASKLFETSDGRKFYVSAQLRKQHMQRLIEKAKSWGIEIIRIS